LGDFKKIVIIKNNSGHEIFSDIRNISLDIKNILVGGGGGSAAEYAMILKKRGHNVTLSYRGEEFSKMIDSNSLSLQ